MNTFIFGLDGADPELVNKWIDQGDLPNLKKIRDSGLSGKLKSTFPPITGPAWTTFQTGVNPGKHGVFNWLDLRKTYSGKAISRNSIKTTTIWNLISKAGGKVGLVSLPLTYPPEPVNGFIVPGFLAPEWEPNKSYPDQVTKDLSENFPEFNFMPPYFKSTSTPKKWVEKLKRTVKVRGKAARFLYKHYLQDNEAIFMVHFYSTDVVQHKLWGFKESGWNPILEVFKEVDKQIGKLMELSSEKSTKIAMSDHGFGPVDTMFNVNNWLHEKGFLKFKSNASSYLKKKLFDFGFTQEKLKPLGDRLFSFAKKLNFIENFTTDPLTDNKLKTLFLSHKNVDWQSTKAYSRSDIGHIRINQKEREPQGVVDKKSYKRIRKELISNLENVKLPGTDKKLLSWVKPKEDVYKGPFLKHAPNILFNPLPNKATGYGAVMFTSPNTFEVNSSFDPGHHRQNGILIASGPTVTTGKEDAEIKDIAPTILNLAGYPIPEQLDGTIIEKIAPGKPKYFQPKNFYKREKQINESNGTREKLENLGYL